MKFQIHYMNNTHTYAYIYDFSSYIKTYPYVIV